MDALAFDPVYLTIALPAAAIGLFVGVLVTWLIGISRNKRMAEERESAFELANAKLTQAFSEISNRSLHSLHSTTTNSATATSPVPMYSAQLYRNPMIS